MHRRHLYGLLLAFLLQQPAAGAADSQSYLQPGLSSDQGRKGQAQELLEHKPVKEPSCEQFVCHYALLQS